MTAWVAMSHSAQISEVVDDKVNNTRKPPSPMLLTAWVWAKGSLQTTRPNLLTLILSCLNPITLNVMLALTNPEP